MQYQPDIVILDRSGAAVAIVEVKALSGAGVQSGTLYLRNLFAHGVVPYARYALLITPHEGYLWSSPEEVLQQSAPSLTFPMGRIVRHYLPSEDGNSMPVRDLVLESIVKQWLSDLADGIDVDDSVTSSLRESGFLNAIRDGLVDEHASL